MPENTTPAAGSAEKPIVTKAVPAYTPWAFRATKLRDGAAKFVAELKPDGNPDPAHVRRIKDFVLATIASFPAEFNAVEIMVEANNTVRADQTHVIVWPKQL